MVIAAEPRFHVLAVDDSVTDRKLIERLLKTSSYQVTTVDSGNKALEFLGLHRDHTNSPYRPCYQQGVDVNLIITDYCMPGMTGYDLLKKIKESSYLRDIPVVIMSSENAPSRINRCLEEGAEEFFLKPVQLSDMKRLRPRILTGKSREILQDQQQPQEHQQEQANYSSDIYASPTISSIFNKRKATEENLSPEKTRARYSTIDSLTVV